MSWLSCPEPTPGATVTYLFEGEIMHRDSLGSEVAIRPGACAWWPAPPGAAPRR